MVGGIDHPAQQLQDHSGQDRREEGQEGRDGRQQQHRGWHQNRTGGADNFPLLLHTSYGWPMFRWSVSASLGQAHQAWRLPSASFCLEGNIVSCKKFSLNLVLTKTVISFVEHHSRSLYRTYHAMDLLNEINDVVRSNLNCETPEVVSLEMWKKLTRDVKKKWFQETFNFWKKLSEETATKEEIRHFFCSRHYRWACIQTKSKRGAPKP